MRLGFIIVCCMFGLLGTSLSLALHPVSRLETVGDRAGPFFDHSLLWSRPAVSPVSMHHPLRSKNAFSQGLVVTRIDNPDISAIAKTAPLWNLNDTAYRLAIRPAAPTLDGEAALKALQQRALDTELEAQETESKIPELKTRQAQERAAAEEDTLEAIDSETRRRQQALEELDFQGARFEAIRSAEAEAIEIRLTAEAELELARLQAESDRARAEMLSQPGGHLYTALEANRHFDVRRMKLVPTSPDVIRYFGGIALWRDFFFSTSDIARSKRSSSSPASR